MTDPDRGAYTPPTDAPLTFDARRPASGGGGRPIPFTLILSILVLGAMVAAVVFFYRGGVRGEGDAPQPVGTPIGEIMAPATAESQPADPAAGLEIYKSDDMGAETPTFAPPPEQPQARPTTPVQTAAIAPVQTAPVAAAPLPVAKPAPVVVAAKPPASKPVAATPPPAKTTTPGSYVVQIGAVSSKALADTAWSQAVAIAGGSGKGKSVTEVEVNGGTLYRTSVTGFTTKESAAAFCAKLSAAGKSCFVR
jgi:cell division protein FtsN